ncbi:armadillo-type protein [Coprinopsis sp. MPI-PUGE-AT-0042]|nr:armadillo-type protein [Coprinopsis sp. MPI-PUGE-AT-0042]
MLSTYSHTVPGRGRKIDPPDVAPTYQFGSVLTPHHPCHSDTKLIPMTSIALHQGAFVPLEDKPLGAASPTASSTYTLVDEDHSAGMMAMPGHFTHGPVLVPPVASMSNPYGQVPPLIDPTCAPQSACGYLPTGMVEAKEYAQHPLFPPPFYGGGSAAVPSIFFHPQAPGSVHAVPYYPEHAPTVYPFPVHFGQVAHPTHTVFPGAIQGPYENPPPYHTHDKRLASPVEYYGPLVYGRLPHPPFSYPIGLPYPSPPVAHMMPAFSSTSVGLQPPSALPQAPAQCPQPAIGIQGHSGQPHRDLAVERDPNHALGRPPVQVPPHSPVPKTSKDVDERPMGHEPQADPLVVSPADPHVFKPRSALLIQFRANRSRQWTISDVKGHICEFSQDLFASRFIQDSITSHTEFDIIFEELSAPSNLLAVAMNSSGNYVVQKLLANSSVEQRNVLNEMILQHFVQLSLDTYGCRVIQYFIDLAYWDLRARIAKAAEPHILSFVKHVNANHVVQKLLGLAPPNCMGFIVPLLRGRVAEIAKDDYGCRVLQRCFHDLPDHVARPLVHEFLPYTLEMVTHEFGNFVVQKILESGAPMDRAVIFQNLQGNFLRCAQHKFGSNVCERALEYADPAVRRSIIREILVLVNRFPKGVYQLMVHQYGNYVLQKALLLAEGQQLSELSMAAEQQLAYARRAKCSPGHRNRDKQLESIEVILNRSRH